jgi:hypothetical protein
MQFGYRHGSDYPWSCHAVATFAGDICRSAASAWGQPRLLPMIEEFRPGGNAGKRSAFIRCRDVGVGIVGRSTYVCFIHSLVDVMQLQTIS